MVTPASASSLLGLARPWKPWTLAPLHTRIYTNDTLLASRYALYKRVRPGRRNMHFANFIEALAVSQGKWIYCRPSAWIRQLLCCWCASSRDYYHIHQHRCSKWSLRISWFQIRQCLIFSRTLEWHTRFLLFINAWPLQSHQFIIIIMPYKHQEIIQVFPVTN